MSKKVDKSGRYISNGYSDKESLRIELQNPV